MTRAAVAALAALLSIAGAPLSGAQTGSEAAPTLDEFSGERARRDAQRLVEARERAASEGGGANSLAERTSALTAERDALIARIDALRRDIDNAAIERATLGDETTYVYALARRTAQAQRARLLSSPLRTAEGRLIGAWIFAGPYKSSNREQVAHLVDAAAPLR